MKSKLTIFIAALFIIVALFVSIFTLYTNSQSTAPKTKAKLIEFTNANSKFIVPSGKTWVINNVFSSDIYRVYIKSINGEILTDFNKLRRPSLQLDADHFPIILPENTRFELIVLDLNYGDTVTEANDSAKVLLNYTETDN